MKVSIKDLRDHLSAYIKKVQLGEEMIIFSHDKPLAKIIPFTNQNSVKMTRKEWINKIHQRHYALGKIKLKESISESIIRRRKEERY